MGIRGLIIVVIVLSSIQSFGQTKVIHNGDACYLHVVEKGNTLYGISKKYAVTIPELIKANPTAVTGLSIGQKLYVPIADINRREAKKSPELNGDLLVHKVCKGETLYSLSKKYSLDINDILEANPTVQGESLRKGSLIRIPTVDVKTEKSHVTPAVQDSLLHHEVIPGETLYSLSQYYQVDIDSVRTVNGGLPEGLKAGMTLRIPRFRDGYHSNAMSDNDARVDTNIQTLKLDPRLNMKIGLLLPFALAGTDSSGTVIPREKNDIMKLTDIAYEFYRGVQLGLDELSLFGLHADVTVIDVTGEQVSIDKCIAQNGLEEMDLIIGPLHKDAFEQLSASSKLKNVFRTSPLSSKLNQASSKDEMVSKLKPSDSAMMRTIVSDIKERHLGANVVLLSGAVKSWHTRFKKEWGQPDSSGSASGPTELKEVSWDKNAQDRLKAALKLDGKNIIVFPVEHRPSITDLVSKLATTEFRDLDITLYGMEQWMKYDNLDAEVLERVNLHLPTSRFIDWEEKETVEFIQKFQDEFNTIPSSSAYGLVAYDLVKFYVEGMMMYGEDFLNHQDQAPFTGLATGFHMKKTTGGAWVNEFGYVLEYKDHQFKQAVKSSVDFK